MKHLRIMLPCLLVVFAVSAVASASASAAEPAFWQCVKTEKVGTKYTGHYSGKKCEESTYDAEGGKEYEFEEWNAENKSRVTKFTGSLSSGLYWEVHELGPFKCPKATYTGDVTGPKTLGNIELTFTKCEWNKKPMENTATSGEIKMNTLKGELGYFDEEEGQMVPREVGLELQPQTGTFWATEIHSAFVDFQMSGSVIGEVDPSVYNVFDKEMKLTFRESNGLQGIPHFEGMPEAFLLMETCGVECLPYGEAGMNTETTQKGEELELKA